MSEEPDGIVEEYLVELSEIEDLSHWKGAIDAAFFENENSKYFSWVNVGEGNFRLEDIVLRIDPDNTVTATMLLHWGKLKTHQGRGTPALGPHLFFQFLDEQRVPVARDWKLGQVNKNCSSPLRWRHDAYSNVPGAFDKTVKMNAGHSRLSWWYC